MKRRIGHVKPVSVAPAGSVTEVPAALAGPAQAPIGGAARVTKPSMDAVHAELPDIPLVDRTWGCRSDDHWYRAEVRVAELGMTVAHETSRFDFQGPGPLHPDEVRAGMNARIGRAGLQVYVVVLHEITVEAYSDLGPTGRT